MFVTFHSNCEGNECSKGSRRGCYKSLRKKDNGKIDFALVIKSSYLLLDAGQGKTQCYYSGTATYVE